MIRSILRQDRHSACGEGFADTDPGTPRTHAIQLTKGIQETTPLTAQSSPSPSPSPSSSSSVQALPFPAWPINSGSAETPIPTCRGEGGPMGVSVKGSTAEGHMKNCRRADGQMYIVTAGSQTGPACVRYQRRLSHDSQAKERSDAPCLAACKRTRNTGGRTPPNTSSRPASAVT